MRRLFLRAVAALAWRSPKHRAKKYLSFAEAEWASRLDMLEAANACDDPERASAYIRHALDETRHAHLFQKAAIEYGLTKEEVNVALRAVKTERLFERMGEAPFLNFVSLGERSARQQFEVYIDFFARQGDFRDQKRFEAILSDEIRHENYTLAFAKGLSSQATHRSSATLSRLWNAWLRAGGALTKPIYHLATSLLYLLVGFPLFIWVRLFDLTKGPSS